ncbi:HAD family phosphatase [Granulicella sp. dw_53]|uniref:HAD family hydrolase n=1 Tax=Granulicella sp. dw_53 TaxID=2719792 RepID=UPI001BD5734C|nr:HAD family phosphatase [Granulicella sp. dw_53]
MTTDLVEGSFSGLIFDCDGTLVDTAPLHYYALQVGLKPHGLAMESGWYFDRVGLTPKDLLDEFEALVGPVEREKVLAGYTVAFQEGLSRLQEVQVIATIAREWKGRVPMMVASNGQRGNVEGTLRATGLLGLFDGLVAAEDVKRGKPAPDVFLEAARRMGVAPERCVVFEDSDEGLEAARLAGMDGRDIRLVFTPEWKRH